MKKTPSSKEPAPQLLLITSGCAFVGASVAMLFTHRAIADVFDTGAASNGTTPRGLFQATCNAATAITAFVAGRLRAGHLLKALCLMEAPVLLNPLAIAPPPGPMIASRSPCQRD